MFPLLPFKVELTYLQIDDLKNKILAVVRDCVSARIYEQLEQQW